MELLLHWRRQSSIFQGHFATDLYPCKTLCQNASTWRHMLASGVTPRECKSGSQTQEHEQSFYKLLILNYTGIKKSGNQVPLPHEKGSKSRTQQTSFPKPAKLSLVRAPEEVPVPAGNGKSSGLEPGLGVPTSLPTARVLCRRSWRWPRDQPAFTE